MVNEYTYRTIDIERRGVGRRYTWLPVDSLDRSSFTIDCTGAYVRPAMYDIRPGDIVRWREGAVLVEGVIGHVDVGSESFAATIEQAHPLPPETFCP